MKKKKRGTKSLKLSRQTLVGGIAGGFSVGGNVGGNAQNSNGVAGCENNSGLCNNNNTNHSQGCFAG
jgi:hypothetical protein